MHVLAALLAAVTWLALPASAARQSDAGFVPLWNGTFDGWTAVNAEGPSFSISNGLLRVEGGGGWLRSQKQYSDFVLRVEFRWVTVDADSGIYVRTIGDREFVRGWPGNGYQVQVRDPKGQSRFPPVGALFRHQTPPGSADLDEDGVARAYRGTGEWHTMEIEAIGARLTVRLNGIEIGSADNIVNAAGFIGVQSELGVTEYRRIDIGESLPR
jgi:hypothetical protein